MVLVGIDCGSCYRASLVSVVARQVKKIGDS